MKKTLCSLLFVALAGASAFANAGNPLQSDAPLKARAAMQKPQLLFIENNGQVADDQGRLHPEILFTAQAGGTSIFVTGTSIHYVFRQHGQEEKGMSEATGLAAHDPLHESQFAPGSLHHFRVDLVGANPNAQLIKGKAQAYYENHYQAHCPQGITAKSFERFTLKNIYPGVDWVVYSTGQGMKYDFVAQDARLASQIKLKVSDAEAGINAAGELVMMTPLGYIKEQKPVSYQNGREVATRFTRQGANTFGFALSGASAGAVVVDPTVLWATYAGGNGDDWSTDVAVDGSGNILLSGYCESNDFPVANAFQATYGGGSNDALAVKYDADGQKMWATYFGGTADDRAWTIALAADSTVFMGGHTYSADLPMVGGSTTTRNGASDGFLIKLNKEGAAVWSRFFGETGTESIHSIEVGPVTGKLIIAGLSSSSNLATAGASQATNMGGTDAFLSGLDTTGTGNWCTYLGGTANESYVELAVDSMEHFYLAGSTYSSNFPDNRGGSTNGGSNAYVAAYDSAGQFQWSTIFGGQSDDFGRKVTANSTGIYVTGWSQSNDMTTSTGMQTALGGTLDAFVAAFSLSGQRTWSTYLGGSGAEEGHGITLDDDGNVIVTGFSSSGNFPATTGGQASTNGLDDVFLAKFSPSGQTLFAGLFGSTIDDSPRAVVATGGKIYINGWSNSPALATPGSAQPTHGGGANDAFLMVIDDAIASSTKALKTAEISLFPNPAHHSLNLSGLGADARISLVNSLGQQVLSSRASHNALLDLKGLPVGIYTLRLTQGGQTSQHRLVIE